MTLPFVQDICDKIAILLTVSYFLFIFCIYITLSFILESFNSRSKMANLPLRAILFNF